MSMFYLFGNKRKTHLFRISNHFVIRICFGFRVSDFTIIGLALTMQIRNKQ
ncbi:hypothetical protein KsCSTR_10360 [Candidatus Kuenenia stuttgartiensis]|uniref:Uncharacterized protein n=1 Tax=Kuenenia stuttgartiensis TaxID=174633 RepID=Q1PYS1_KUEST|nr:hypothetical protein KsCSTR_10360 [Candidatus Kuenenia stuttgartiensis]CAJ72222.1 unknown protein [Candidatus Kuenenia stuttgartiensis]